ncbi:MAG: hypothetical protein VYD70_04545, partial [Planctomycetota bacterium]|nr:hypothetical protein [Planctomycetota bacterium]
PRGSRHRWPVETRPGVTGLETCRRETSAAALDAAINPTRLQPAISAPGDFRCAIEDVVDSPVGDSG